LYGIDAVRKSVWDTADFDLDPPPEAVECTILCMHELLEPPAEEIVADHPVEDVFDSVPIDLDGLALGDLHQPKSAHVDGTDVWYASATERCAKDEDETGIVQHLEIENGRITRRQLELDTRPFAVLTIAFGEQDGSTHARDVLDRHDLDDAVAKIELAGERNSVTANEVAQMAREAGAAVVSIDDNRGRVDLDVGSIEAMSLQGLDSAIEERLADLECSQVALEIDGRVREAGDLSDNVDRVADEIEKDLQAAQEAAFDDISISEESEAEDGEERELPPTTGGDE
jgi:predicted ThiF/HesA family dinucleotide-utilizing enzyme